MCDKLEPIYIKTYNIKNTTTRILLCREPADIRALDVIILFTNYPLNKISAPHQFTAYNFGSWQIGQNSHHQAPKTREARGRWGAREGGGYVGGGSGGRGAGSRKSRVGEGGRWASGGLGQGAGAVPLFLLCPPIFAFFRSSDSAHFRSHDTVDQ